MKGIPMKALSFGREFLSETNKIDDTAGKGCENSPIFHNSWCYYVPIRIKRCVVSSTSIPFSFTNIYVGLIDILCWDIRENLGYRYSWIWKAHWQPSRSLCLKCQPVTMSVWLMDLIGALPPLPWITVQPFAQLCSYFVPYSPNVLQCALVTKHSLFPESP